jgi:chromosome segregation ATPase
MTLSCPDRVVELEATVELLQQQLQEQEDEANGVISQWQESYNEADKRCTEIEKEMEEFRKSKDSPRFDVQENVEENRHPQTQDEELISRIEGLETELTEEREALAGDEDIINQWEGMFRCAGDCVNLRL